MRIGLVGVGRIGAFHAATLKGLACVEQVVVADADSARAMAVAKELGLEQDTVLAGPPAAGDHSPMADVQASIAHLLTTAEGLS